MPLAISRGKWAQNNVSKKLKIKMWLFWTHFSNIRGRWNFVPSSRPWWRDKIVSIHNSTGVVPPKKPCNKAMQNLRKSVFFMTACESKWNQKVKKSRFCFMLRKVYRDILITLLGNISFKMYTFYRNCWINPILQFFLHKSFYTFMVQFFWGYIILVGNRLLPPRFSSLVTL